MSRVDAVIPGWLLVDDCLLAEITSDARRDSSRAMGAALRTCHLSDLVAVLHVAELDQDGRVLSKVETSQSARPYSPSEPR